MTWWQIGAAAPTPVPADDPGLAACVREELPVTLIALSDSTPMRGVLVALDGGALTVELDEAPDPYGPFGPRAAALVVVQRGPLTRVVVGAVDGPARPAGPHRRPRMSFTLRSAVLEAQARREPRTPVPPEAGFVAALIDRAGRRHPLELHDLGPHGVGGALPAAADVDLPAGARVAVEVDAPGLPPLRSSGEVRMRQLPGPGRRGRCGVYLADPPAEALQALAAAAEAARAR